MTITIRATYDGEVFRTAEPVDLPPDTEVVLKIELAVPSHGLLDTAESLTIDGPEDWSERFEDYLQAQRTDDHESGT